MSKPDYRALQAYGCKDAKFVAPGEQNVKHMSMGSWRANLAKGGVLSAPSSGGSPKPKKKRKLRFQQIMLDGSIRYSS